MIAGTAPTGSVICNWAIKKIDLKDAIPPDKMMEIADAPTIAAYMRARLAGLP